MASRLTGWRILGTVRRPEDVARLENLGVEPASPEAVGDADAVLVTAPPDDEGCPGFRALAPHIGARARWVGYLSTTGVYGDLAGRWAFERSAIHPQSTEAARRAAAEAAWTATGLPLAIFRLPGLYARGRSAFDRLRDGTARRIARPGHVFSRLHLDDLALGLAASLGRPRPGAVYNLCDDEPAPSSDVTAYAARLLGLSAPPETPFHAAGLSPAAQRFWAENRRVSNALAKAELGWRPAYPTYREGLAAILAAGG
ncbi:SDR family NAD(P)-dependent oxidoreductase [Phenylobacterium immobile]|uniref:SDR family NAD(P)-dependent oxidoreductase n=1 Tax=Phenylobacterium immobile TaxID=21 RepID=UPI000B2C73FD|nr:SDR family NAD(P)-dependent oxidoreductase [Phenylobacterium immobile]